MNPRRILILINVLPSLDKKKIEQIHVEISELKKTVAEEDVKADTVAESVVAMVELFEPMASINQDMRQIQQRILDQAREVEEINAKRYRRLTWVTYVLTTIVLGLGLVGRLVGIDTV